MTLLHPDLLFIFSKNAYASQIIFFFLMTISNFYPFFEVAYNSEITCKLKSLAFIVKRCVFWGTFFAYNAMSSPLLFLNFADFAKKKYFRKISQKFLELYMSVTSTKLEGRNAFRSNVILQRRNFLSHINLTMKCLTSPHATRYIFSLLF